MTCLPPRPDPLRAYVVGPSGGDPVERLRTMIRYYDALVAIGYDVASPCGVHLLTGCTEELLAQVDNDLAALELCDYVVVLPGGEQLFEVLLAPSLGKPVVHVSDIAELLLDAA